MKLIDGDRLEKHLDYLIQKEKQLAKKCALSPNNEYERQRRYCFEADALAYGLCKNVMNYYLVDDTQPADPWVSVNDKLPETNAKGVAHILVYDEYEGVVKADFFDKFAHYRYGSNIFVISTTSTQLYRVTHWQPLPEPPKGGEPTRNLTDEETEIYESWIDHEAKNTGVNITDGDTE